jgi:hypothetical protein
MVAVLAVFLQLANAIVQAAGGDAYHEVRELVVKYLARFRSKAELEQGLDATEQRVRANPKSRASEAEIWATELSDIASISAGANAAVHDLSQKIINIGSSGSYQVSGDNSPNQSVNITFNGPPGSGYYGQGRSDDQTSRPVRPGSPRNSSAPARTASPRNSSASPNLKTFGIFIGIAIIIVFLIYSCSNGGSTTSSAFPQHGDSWPKGATASSIIAPVVQRLNVCANEPTQSPANCPQSVGDSYSGVSNVRWGLHGDPADGARIVYLDGQFQVAGSVVMTATYNDYQGSEFSLQLVNYHAWVVWNNGNPSLIGITSFNSGTPPAVVKHKPSFSWPSVASATLNAFHQCATYRTAPLPPQCPNDPNSPIDGSNAQWQLDNDPLGNAGGCFDPSTGLIHVTGSFYMSVSYSVVLFGTQHSDLQGNYRASVAIDDGKPVVLQIEDVGNSTTC